MAGRAWRDVLLVVSLAINVFILGLALGGRAALWRDPGPPPAERQLARQLRAGEFSPRAFIAALPPEQRRKAIARALRAGRDSWPQVAEAGAARRAAVEAILADPFDREAALAALARARAIEVKLKTEADRLVVDLLAELPPALRQRAIEASLSSEGRRRGLWRRWDRPEGPPALRPRPDAPDPERESEPAAPPGE